MLAMSLKEKAEAFDQLSDCFLRQNFGTVKNAEIELKFFSIILEHLLEHGQPYDDYALSNLLGIKQAKVRELKVEKQLRYRHAFDWRQALVSRVKNVRCSADGRWATVNLDDPNLQIEVENYLEQHGHQYDYSLNKKLLKGMN